MIGIELGMKVKDVVTGFCGVVTAKCVYLHQEPRVLIEGIDNTGRPIEWWHDVSRLQIIDAE